MRCAACGSEQTRKCSVVYEEGTQSGTISVTPGGGSPLHAEQVTSSAFAKRCRPPLEPHAGGFVADIVISLVLTCLWAAIVVRRAQVAGREVSPALLMEAIVVAIVLWFVLHNWVRPPLWRWGKGKRLLAAYRDALGRWRKSWICSRCGEISTETGQ